MASQRLKEQRELYEYRSGIKASESGIDAGYKLAFKQASIAVSQVRDVIIKRIAPNANPVTVKTDLDDILFEFQSRSIGMGDKTTLDFTKAPVTE